MADRLYLSLWFPNFRQQSLAPALVSVLKQFNTPGRAARVRAATVYPISFNETPVYQRVYSEEEAQQAAPEAAVAEATASMHDDYAYEFELPWDLWQAETVGGLDTTWKLQPVKVAVTGFTPSFDEGAYEQNGHIRVELGLDTPFLLEEVDLDQAAAEHIKKNIQKLVELTQAIQENCGISSRLLWSESGDNLAEKLIARLQRVN